MDMIGRIRRLHSRKNKSAREIARITGLSRNTVAKRVRFYSTVDLVNALEQEKAQGKAGRIAASLLTW